MAELAIGLINLLALIIPKVTAAVRNGQETPEAQAALRAKYNALRAQGDAAFSGPEWDVD